MLGLSVRADTLLVVLPIMMARSLPHCSNSFWKNEWQSLATLGLVTLPPILGAYRQFGILRRLRTTPVHPARLLSAQLAVHIGIALAAAVIAIVVAVAVFDVPFPESPVWFVVSYVLAAASIFSLGLLVGAVAPTAATGQAIGMAIYFPMLFFAGVWIPRTIMPDGLRTVSDFTPLGSAVQALEDSWFGSTPSLTNLVVMAVWADFYILLLNE